MLYVNITIPTVLETKPYQVDPSQVNSYLYQQTLPKNKAVIPWILHELSTPPRRSRPNHIKEPIITPQEAETHLPDPRSQDTSDISSEKEIIS